MKWLHFILSHSIFISLCAVALCYQTYVLTGLPQSWLIYLLVFNCTLCSYNAYWLLSKHRFNSPVSPVLFIRLHFSNVILFVLPMMFVVAYVIYHPQVVRFLVVAGIITLMYTLPLWPIKILKRSNAGFMKTLLLALTWTYVTIIIPTQVNLSQINISLALLFITRFLFMLMLCTVFDSRDSEVDKVRGLKSLATDVSAKYLRVIVLSTFILYVIFGIILRYHIHSLPQALAFIITGLLVLAVYFLSLKKRGYLFYYFLVDGLMLFSAIATFVAANV